MNRYSGIISASLIHVVFVSGCASPTTTTFRSPDGTVMKEVSCNIDRQKCFQTATNSCPESNGSYRVISSHSNAGGTLAEALPGPITWYHMTITCGQSDGIFPDFPFRGQEYVPAPVIINQPPAQQPRNSQTDCTVIGNNINCRSY